MLGRKARRIKDTGRTEGRERGREGENGGGEERGKEGETNETGVRKDRRQS